MYKRQVIDEDLTENIAVQSAAHDEDVLTYGNVHLFHDVFRGRYRVD